MKRSGTFINYLISIGLLLVSCTVESQNFNNQKPTIKGTLALDSIWAPKVYLSSIDSFKELYTMSSSMIIAEAPIDPQGNFAFDISYLPEEDKIYRIHISKKNGPAASLIIGGDEENHLFLVANGRTSIHLEKQAYNTIAETQISGYNPAVLIHKVYKIASLKDSTQLGGSYMKSEFMTNVIEERLRTVADTTTHPLVSLFALHKSNFKNNLSSNIGFYEAYLGKWETQESLYFKEFRKELNLKAKNTTWIYVIISISAFILGVIVQKLFKKNSFNKTNSLQSLSIQERKIFEEIKKGKSNKEISETFNIGVSTVKTHVSNIYAKLNIKSRKEALDI